MLILKIHSTDSDEVREVQIDRFPATFGRASLNTVVILEGGVSNRHGVVEETPEGYILKDLGSTNGIYSEGAKKPEVVLKVGVDFVLGNVRVEVDSIKAPEKTKAVSTAVMQRISMAASQHASGMPQPAAVAAPVAASAPVMLDPTPERVQPAPAPRVHAPAEEIFPGFKSTLIIAISFFVLQLVTETFLLRTEEFFSVVLNLLMAVMFGGVLAFALTGIAKFFDRDFQFKTSYFRAWLYLVLLINLRIVMTGIYGFVQFNLDEPKLFSEFIIACRIVMFFMVVFYGVRACAPKMSTVKLGTVAILFAFFGSVISSGGQVFKQGADLAGGISIPSANFTQENRPVSRMLSSVDDTFKKVDETRGQKPKGWETILSSLDL